MIADAYLELFFRPRSNQWTAHDSQGRIYTFSQIEGGNSPLWYLTQVTDRTGNNKITFEYELDRHEYCDERPWRAWPDVQLSTIEYSFDPTGTYPKHRIVLEYRTWNPPDSKLTECVQQISTTPPIQYKHHAFLGHDLGNGSARTKMRVVEKIAVYSQAGDPPADSDYRILKAYFLHYSIDADTAMPRLAQIKLGGEGDVDDTSALPMSLYQYGSALVDNVLSYPVSSTVPLPSDSTSASPGFASSRQGYTLGLSPNRAIGSDHMLMDFTGDGLPDQVYRVGGQQVLQRNVTDATGTSLNSPDARGPFFPLADLIAWTGQQVIRGEWLETEMQILDWNGDGRLDVLWAQREDKDNWYLFLNTPEPGEGPEAIEWQKRHVYIAHIRTKLKTLGYEFESDFLPLSRARTHKDIWLKYCYEYHLTDWHLHRADCPNWPPPESPGLPPPEPTNPASIPRDGKTITEWKLLDVNGDSHPDFVLSRIPPQVNVFDNRSEECPTAEELERRLGTSGDGTIAHCEYKEDLFSPATTTSDGPFTSTDYNDIFVYYNTSRGPAPSFTHAATTLIQDLNRWSPDDAECGLERWREGDEGGMDKGGTWMECGFVEVNGDGLVDYYQTLTGGVTRVLLNQGVPLGFVPTSLNIPGRVASMRSERSSVCGTGAAWTVFDSRHLSSLVDLTGDGIPDYVYHGPDEDDLVPRWRIRVGTGSGFTGAKLIGSALSFELSLTRERCDGELARTVAGLVDINSDGRPDMIWADPGQLKVAQLRGSSTTAGAHDAGRLRSISNGYRGTTQIEYGSAKIDTHTPHQVPFAEIVVAKTTVIAEPVGDRTLGTSLEPTHYAYGNASLRYDALLSRWTFAGYRRYVTLQGLKSAHSSDDAADPVESLEGTATIYDALGADEVAPGYDRYALVSRLRDAHFLNGRFTTDPWDLVGLFIPTDPRWHGNRHVDYQAQLQPTADDPSAYENECFELEHPYIFGFPAGANSQLCRHTGVVYSAQVRSWTGTQAPPSSASTEMRTRTVNVDGFGRPLLISLENDTARDDDDLCISLTYSTSVATGAHIVDAVHAARILSSCSADNPPAVTYAGTRYRYDHLEEGKVEAGLLSHRIVERYNAQTGERLNPPEFIADIRHHDDFGNVVSLISPNESITRTQSVAFDAFGLTPHLIMVESAGTELMTSFRHDPISSLLRSVTDYNGVELKRSYDKFGRLNLFTIVPNPGDREYILSRTEYLDDNPADANGKRIRKQEFHTWIPKDTLVGATLDPSDVTRSTAYFDELGRLRFVERGLGSSYGDKTLVTQYIEYDGLGRPTFVASPFEQGEMPSLQYGTSFHYYSDNRLRCRIDGEGPQAFTTLTNESLDRYPHCFSYSFRDHQLAIQIKGPNELLPGSPQADVYDEVISTATGRIILKSREKEGIRLGLVDYGYNRLGHLTDVRRWTKPSVAGVRPVLWSYNYDSLGQLLEIRQPNASARKFTFDNQGNLSEFSWLDSETPPRTRVVRNSFDGFNRLTKVEHITGGESDPQRTYHYYYDLPSGDTDHLVPVTPTNLRGRMAYACDAEACEEGNKTFFGYDSLGRLSLISQVRPLEPDRQFMEERKYTPTGQLRALGFRLPDTHGELETVDYTYDSARRVRGVTWTDSFGTSPIFQAAAIDAFGRYQDVRLGNGVTATFAYRPNRRRELEEQIITNATDTRASSYLGFDGLNRLKARSERIVPRGGTAGITETTTYAYNALNQLERARTIRGTLAHVVRDESFLYDPLGNLAKINDHVGLTALRLIQDIRDPDRLCRSDQLPFSSDDPEAPPFLETDSLSCTYGYDALGNITRIQDTAGSARTFVYDSLSKLVETRNGAASAIIRDDPFGNVSELTLTNASAGVKRRDRRRSPLVEESEFSILGEPESSDPNKQPFIERRIPGPMGIIAARRGARDSSVVLYHHGDASANRLFTDKEGRIVQHVDYRAYGDIHGDSGDEGTATYTKYLWNRGATLELFGITLLGDRTYTPQTGRFVQRDPLTIARSASQANPYTFAFGDPVNFADPTGLDPCAGASAEVCLGNAPPSTSGEWWPGLVAGAIGTAAEWLFGGRGSSSGLTGPQPDQASGSTGSPGVSYSWYAPEPYWQRRQGEYWNELAAPGRSAWERAGSLGGWFVTGIPAFLEGVARTPYETFELAELTGEAAARASLAGGWIGKVEAIGEAIAYGSQAFVQAGGMVEGARIPRGAPSGVVSATTPAQVQLNRTAGNAFRDEIADLLRQALSGRPGYVVRTEVYKRTPFFKRFIDVHVEVLGDDFAMHIGGIEAKLGLSRYGPWQRLKDMWLKRHGYPVDVVRDR
ncbi:RHS repeat domain-containing protein [Microvirga sp. VF16]|uniref:RHS repeat domain-containing protein n=1 Tax=Microvirga sp. VF16 TaxID=2807101 RepID=UPI00193CF04D|nr:RHS repeat-associated core domain-containing protein [Microvirga sp. VF16]QRM35743.1 hypothetical protein JO965_43895 [Microvirga sp. VF16]